MQLNIFDDGISTALASARRAPRRHMDAKTPLRSVLYGGCASILAEVATIPVDVLKVRMQLQGESGHERQYKNTLDAVLKISRQEGPMAFTKGLGPAVLRQMTYGSLRFGFYATFKEALGVVKNSTEPALLRKLAAAGMSGGTSAFMCNPLDLIKVRMQADGMRSSGLHRTEGPRYRGVLSATVSIVRKEGFLGLYTGVAPTTARATVVAAAEIASYDEIKCAFLRQGFIAEGMKLHFATAMLSGFLATAASSPFDVVRARIMSQPLDKSGVGLWYRGTIDCFAQSYQVEGVRFAWQGFWPNYMCKGPTVVLLFLLYEQIQRHGDRFLDGLAKQ